MLVINATISNKNDKIGMEIDRNLIEVVQKQRVMKRWLYGNR